MAASPKDKDLLNLTVYANRMSKNITQNPTLWVDSLSTVLMALLNVTKI